MNWQTIGVLFSILMGIGAIILTTGMKINHLAHINEAIKKLDDSITALKEKVAEIDKRLALVEDREKR